MLAAGGGFTLAEGLARLAAIGASARLGGCARRGLSHPSEHSFLRLRHPFQQLISTLAARKPCRAHRGAKFQRLLALADFRPL